MALVAEKISSCLFSFNQPSPPTLNKLPLPNSAALFKKTNTTTFVGYRISTSGSRRRRICVVLAFAADQNSIGGGVDGVSKKKVPISNYVVPFDSSSCITRPLGEILRDLNKRIPDNIIIKPTSTIDQDADEEGDGDDDQISKTYIPWYHANRMLSFYAPGWCGEIRDVIFSDNGSVTVVYRVTIRGSDGEAHRESTGTVSPPMDGNVDAVAAAEEIAFCRACARFGLGLYLYHDE